MSRYRVLLIGGGGREHALAWSLAKSPKLQQLFVAPGNPGTASLGQNIDLPSDDFDAIIQFCRSEQIDLVIPGPEKPLVDGLADRLIENGIPVFGPSQKAAQLEGSKEFAKDFMKRHNIPTAAYTVYRQNEFDQVLQDVKKAGRYPVVLKADGLAAGKGVFICESYSETEKRVDQMKSDATLQKASSTLVVEEFMEGEEASLFAICDGNSYHILNNAQDHKRIGEGDTGLNTGGMGAYSPAPLLTDRVLRRIEETILRPVLDGMKQEGTPYSGILYVGLMMTGDGPKVVEFNCRFGDPECQVILPKLDVDFLELAVNAAAGKLEQTTPAFVDGYHCCVVLASGGYPEEYTKGYAIEGIEKVDSDCLIFHAGTSTNDEQAVVTSGGRVLNVVGRGSTLQQAINHAYANVEKISFTDMVYRRDIGEKGLRRLSDS
ncbi:MAG: phosphoribosylamine--glycine ligase [Balneolaceae bacterium]